MKNHALLNINERGILEDIEIERERIRALAQRHNAGEISGWDLSIEGGKCWERIDELKALLVHHEREEGSWPEPREWGHISH